MLKNCKKKNVCLKLYLCFCLCGKSSVLHPVQAGSKLSSVTIMEIEVKGSTEPYQILLEPYAVVIPGEIFICTTIRQQFKVD